MLIYQTPNVKLVVEEDGGGRRRIWREKEQCGKVCFLSRAKETLMVNLTLKQIEQICRVTPSSLYENPTMEARCRSKENKRV